MVTGQVPNVCTTAESPLGQRGPVLGRAASGLPCHLPAGLLLPLSASILLRLAAGRISKHREDPAPLFPTETPLVPPYGL